MMSMNLGNAMVQTTVNRGFTPEEVANRALDKIIHIGENAPDELKAQAIVYRERIREVLEFYMREAVHSYQTTLAAKLTQAGHPELVKLIEGA